MTDYVVPPEWTFTATIQQPDGVRSECTVTVPDTLEYPDVLEVSEMVQMGAVRALSTWRRTRDARGRRASEGTAPF